MVPFQLIGCNNPDVELVVVELTYTTNVPAVTTGRGVTVVDDGTGLFSIVTDFPWKTAWPFLIKKSALAVGGSVQMVSKDAATRKVSFRILNDADAAEDPADADGVIGMIAFQKSGLPA